RGRPASWSCPSVSVECVPPLSAPLGYELSGEERERALELAHPPLHLLEPLHHLLQLRVLLEEPVHVGDLGAAAAGDPHAAAAIDDRGLLALRRRHRGDDGLVAAQLALLAAELLRDPARALEEGHHVHDLLEGAHGAELLEL